MDGVPTPWLTARRYSLRHRWSAFLVERVDPRIPTPPSVKQSPALLVARTEFVWAYLHQHRSPWDEAATGDPRESKKRLAILHTMIPLVVNPAAEAIALGLLDARILPKKAETDALHLGTAMAHNMDCVLSWNFKHLVNPTILRNIYLWAGRAKYNMPVVCTPEDLLRDLS